jgi:hypothetical protein
MGNGLFKESPSATDVRYDPDASDNLIDQSPVWVAYAGSYNAENFTYIADTNDEGKCVPYEFKPSSSFVSNFGC